MTELRGFVLADAATVRAALYPNMELSQVREMIGQWNAGFAGGRRFEMLAVVSDGCIVGAVSLYEQDAQSVSFGIEIAANYRCRGFATEAGRLALCHAEKKGYRKVLSQVRQDNAASIALHRKLGFVLTEKTVNRRGNPVFLYEKDL